MKRIKRPTRAYRIRMAALKLLRQVRRAEGYCPACPQTSRGMPCMEGRKACRSCLKKNRLRQRKVRAKRIENGLCPTCGKPQDGEYERCRECREKRSRYYKELQKRKAKLPAKRSA